MDKKMNTQSKIVKESIFTALMILMEKKDFSELTITEVTKKAGVSRMSFYRHYAILEDVITNYLDELFEDYSKQVIKTENNYEKESIRLFFAYFRTHSRLVTNLIRSNLSHLILERCIGFFYTLSKNFVCSNSHLPLWKKYNIEFAAGGIYRILIVWVKSGLLENDEEMADICYSLMQ
jgi:AcrR family transcriptional regulator